MINYINTQNLKNIMKTKTFYLMAYILFMFSLLSYNAFSITQEQLLRYEFEEGGGTIILDSSGNNYNGIQNAVSWTTNNRWGTYALEFDGFNDYVATLESINIPDQLSISFWLSVDVGITPETILNIYGDTENYLIYVDYAQNSALKLDYVDNTQQTQTLILINNSVDSTYNHFVVSIDSVKNDTCAWKNGVQITCIPLNNGVYKDLLNEYLQIGQDFTNTYDDYDGRMDEFRIFDFVLNDSQVQDLFLNNYITLITTPEPVDNISLVQDILITNFSPQTNDTIYFTDNFEVTTNRLTDCTLYIDNSLIETSYNQVVHKIPNPLTEAGKHQYFWYCEALINNSLIFEISQTQYFNLSENPPKIITFNIVGTDFDVNDLELYITTPCMNEGYSAIGTEYKPYRPEYNKDGIMFSKVVNGFAQFNVTNDKNDYCLYNGRIIINELGKTTNYDIVDIYGVVELGEIQTPNNVTDIYKVTLEQFDIYSKVNPKAWGQTWTSIIGGLILLVLGVTVLIAGIYVGNGKMTLAGAILSMSALGISFTGIVGLVV